MCIAYLALGIDQNWPLLIAANRDEFHARPTRATAPWPDAPTVLGGQDLRGGGTWFAVNQQGRFALLTNYRDLAPPTGNEPSRGGLCGDFLLSDSISAQEYINSVAQKGQNYQGFNLIIGQWQTESRQFLCYYYSNRSQQPPERLAPGHYVLSNHLLNTAWPKSTRLGAGLKKLVETQQFTDADNTYALLRDEQKAADHILPSTGLELERERLLSSPFIISPEYGTRSSSIWCVGQNGHSMLHECQYNPQGLETERHSWPLVFTS